MIMQWNFTENGIVGLVCIAWVAIWLGLSVAHDHIRDRMQGKGK